MTGFNMPMGCRSSDSDSPDVTTVYTTYHCETCGDKGEWAIDIYPYQEYEEPCPKCDAIIVGYWEPYQGD